MIPHSLREKTAQIQLGLPVARSYLHNIQALRVPCPS